MTTASDAPEPTQVQVTPDEVKVDQPRTQQQRTRKETTVEETAPAHPDEDQTDTPEPSDS